MILTPPRTLSPSPPPPAPTFAYVRWKFTNHAMRWQGVPTFRPWASVSARNKAEHARRHAVVALRGARRANSARAHKRDRNDCRPRDGEPVRHRPCFSLLEKFCGDLLYEQYEGGPFPTPTPVLDLKAFNDNQRFVYFNIQEYIVEGNVAEQEVWINLKHVCPGRRRRICA